MKKEDAIRVITSCAKEYRNHLENCNLLFVYGSIQKLEHFEAAFLPQNFLHLTGIELSSKIGSSGFYDKCLNGKLSINDLNFAQNGTTEMKLLILPQLMQIYKSAKMVGNYNNSKNLLVTDKLVGNVAACMGFIKRDAYYIPNTSLKEDIRDIAVKPQQRVLAIFRKNISEDLYASMTYMAKGFTLGAHLANNPLSEKIEPILYSPDFGKEVKQAEPSVASTQAQALTSKENKPDHIDLQITSSMRDTQVLKLSIHDRLAAARSKIENQTKKPKSIIPSIDGRDK